MLPVSSYRSRQLIVGGYKLLCVFENRNTIPDRVIVGSGSRRERCRHAKLSSVTWHTVRDASKLMPLSELSRGMRQCNPTIILVDDRGDTVESYTL